MKFRYILKNKHTGVIHKKVYTLNQIQEGGLSNLFDVENYAIIAINQFTGLADKNGKEIYEGDILKGKFDSAIYRVDFEKGKFVLNHILKYMPDNWGDLSRLFDNDMVELYNDIVVIGNIHENSDLLK